MIANSYSNENAKPHWRPDMLAYPLHIKFDLDFDIDNQYIDGIVTHTIYVVKKIQRLEFNAMNLDVHKIIFEGKELEFENNGSKLIVRIEIDANNTIDLKFYYTVVKPKAGIYFVIPDGKYPDISKQVWTQGQDEDTQFYAPVFDNPAFKHTSEFIGHIPKNWTSLSNGDLISDTIVNNKRVMHWKFNIKHSTYLVTFAAGELSKHSEILLLGDRKININWYTAKGREDEGINAYKNTADIIKFFSEYTGFPYPYSSYSQWSASRFIFGGMENTSATTQTDLTLRDNRALIDSTSDNLVAHEAAHQWFGDWVTAKTWAHAWLHESFATYFDALYTEYKLGFDEFIYQMRANKLAYISEDKNIYRRPIVTNVYEEPIDLFDRHLYPGGSWRVHMLRRILGEDDFRAVLRYFLDKHSQGLVETIDLSRAIEDVTGRNLDWFFDQWIFHAGYPQFKIKYSWDEKYNLAKITIEQTQKIDSNDTISTQLFKIDSSIQFKIEDKISEFPINIHDRKHTFNFHLSSKPQMVRFDPNGDILCTVDFKKSQDLLLYQLINDTSIHGQILAVNTLSKNINHKVLSALQKQLMNDDIFWGVREVIAEDLGNVGGDNARDVLINAINVPHPKVRKAVIKALGKFTYDKKVASILESKIKEGDESYFVEGILLSSLGALKIPETFETITNAMHKPSYNDFALREGINGLVSLDLDKSLDIIIELSEYGDPELARINAISAIGSLGKYRPSRHNECLALLKKYTSDPMFRCRMAAIDGLKNLSLPQAIPVLNKMKNQEADGRVKKNVELAIKSIKDNITKFNEIKLMDEKIKRLEKTNNELRDRLDSLEGKIEK